MKEYPEEATVIFFYNLTVAFIAAIVGVILEKDPNAWILRQNIALASVLCSVRTKKKHSIHSFSQCHIFYIYLTKALSLF